ncbi:MAG: hypothetical protein FWC80_00760 [Firmicutes bacterium]|nr:hypothetical protein [Bacillota bacterium]
MKKIVILLLSTILAFSMLAFSMLVFSACGLTGGGGFRTVNLDIDLNNKPNLNIMFPNTGLSNDVFNDQNNITVRTARELTGYTVNYMQLAATPAALQLHFTNQTNMNAIKVTKAQFDSLVADGALVDLTAGIEKFGPTMRTVISDASWDAVTYEGRIFGIPEIVSNDNVDRTLFFNMVHLRAAGIQTLPTTREELRHALQALYTHHGGAQNHSYRALTFGRFDSFIDPIAASFGLGNQWRDVNGELKFFFEQPEMRDYLEFMHSLRSTTGLIDESFLTQSAADAMSKFINGNASVIVAGWANAVSFLNAPHTNASNVNDRFAALPGLRAEGADGDFVNFQNSGVSFVTVVPWWAANEGGFVIDWIDQKLGEDNFRLLTIGEQGVHHQFINNEYWPILPAFDELNHADNYMMGSNELFYSDFWFARLRKSGNFPDGGYLFNFWASMQPRTTHITSNNPIIGKRNPMRSAPTITEYATVRDRIEIDVEDAIRAIIFSGNVNAAYATALNRWRADGGTAATAAINRWYTNR